MSLIDLDIELVECTFCHQPTPAHTAHPHEDGWVGGDCCWVDVLPVVHYGDSTYAAEEATR